MTSKRLALSLAFASSFLLVACGGGGDAKSPDRPNLRLDPATLRIDFPQGAELPGTASNKTPVRLLGLQTDLINTNLGPELNVTTQANWSITGNPVGSLRDPRVAQLAEDFRRAGNLRDVQDILSTIRLLTTDDTINAKIKYVLNFKGKNYSDEAAFTVVPPKPLGPPFIGGPSDIAFNPLEPNATYTTDYQLLQALVDLSVRENQTDTVNFCTDKPNIVAFEETPYDGAVATTFTSPFTVDNNSDIVNVIISTVRAPLTCDKLGTRSDPNDANSPLIKPVAQKTVRVIPAIVTAMEVCGITNPALNICSQSTGSLNPDFIENCKGLDSPGNIINSINVPAGENTQMVAKLSYTNPANLNQPLLTQYQCSGKDRLSWTTEPTVFDGNGLDSKGGFGDFISQAAYEAIKSSGPQSKVTATFNNGESATPKTISANLTLKLTDANVTSLAVNPVNHVKSNTVLLNLLGRGIAYSTACTFGSVNKTVDAECGDGNISWSVSDSNLLAIDNSQGSNVTVSSVDGVTEGSAVLTAKYTGLGGPHEVITTIDVEIDPIVSVRLLQKKRESEGGARDTSVKVTDSFSCLSTTSPTPPAGKEPLPPAIQYYAHAMFQSQSSGLSGSEIINLPATDSRYFDITNQPGVTFAAIPGYWSGNTSTDRICYSATEEPTQSPEEDGDPEVPTADALLKLPTGLIIANLPALPGDYKDPAQFSQDQRGRMEPIGIQRFATVCVRVFIDTNGNGKYNPAPDPSTPGEPISYEGSSVLISGDGESPNGFCKSNEPRIEAEQSSGPDNQATLPSVYALGLYSDPFLQNSEGMQSAQISSALATGEFPTLDGSIEALGFGQDNFPDNIPSGQTTSK
jgi:hypothetical protein